MSFQTKYISDKEPVTPERIAEIVALPEDEDRYNFVWVLNQQPWDPKALPSLVRLSLNSDRSHIKSEPVVRFSPSAFCKLVAQAQELIQGPEFQALLYREAVEDATTGDKSRST